MKIAICTDAYFLQSDTAASHAYVLEKGLSALGHQVMVLTSDLESDGFYEEKSLAAVTARPSKNAYRQSARLFSIGKGIAALNTFSPDIIQIETLSLLGYQAARFAKKHNIPVVTTVFGLSDALGTSFSGLFAPIPTFFYKYLTCKILELTDVITAFTGKLESELHTIGIEKKITEVPCAVDSEMFGFDTVDPQKIQKFRMKLGLGASKTGIIYAGPLDSSSGLEALLELWAGSVKPADNLQLVIAGADMHPDELTEMAKIRGVTRQLSFAGKVEHEDMPALFRACDAFISTSISTSVHMSPVEAMACGLPALLKQGCSNADFLEEGRNGFTFTNSNQLKKILLSLAGLDTSGKRMLRKLVSSTVRKFDEITEAEAYEEIYRSLRSGGRGISRTAVPSVPRRSAQTDAFFDYEEEEQQESRRTKFMPHSSEETGFGDDYYIGGE